MHLTRTRIGAVAAATALVATLITTTVATSSTTLALPGATESTTITVEPTRVLDTRINVGLTGNFTARTPRKLTITGPIVTSDYANPTNLTPTKTVIPPGATGAIMNVTSFAPTGQGFISIRPGDATGQPSTSNLNVSPGQTVPNSVTIAIPTTGPHAGQIDITYGSALSNTTGIIIDIVGYTTSSGLQDLTNRLVTLETTGVAGPPGPTGPTGPTGPAGPSGADLYTRTVIVNGDGTAAENGAALIAAAGKAASADAVDDPWQVRLEPGVFDIGANQLFVSAFTSLVGAGEDATTVTGSANRVINLRERSSLSELQVQSTSTTNNGSVIDLSSGDNVTVRNVTILSTHPATNGIYIAASNDVRMIGVDINVADLGVAVLSSTRVELLDSRIVSSGDSAVGLGGVSRTDVRVDGSYLQAIGTNDATIRIYNSTGTFELDVLHSTLVSDADASFNPSGSDTDDVVQFFHNHFETSAALSPLGATVLRCAQNSSIDGAGTLTASDTGCY